MPCGTFLMAPQVIPSMVLYGYHLAAPMKLSLAPYIFFSANSQRDILALVMMTLSGGAV